MVRRDYCQTKAKSKRITASFSWMIKSSFSWLNVDGVQMSGRGWHPSKDFFALPVSAEEEGALSFHLFQPRDTFSSTCAAWADLRCRNNSTSGDHKMVVSSRFLFNFIFSPHCLFLIQKVSHQKLQTGDILLSPFGLLLNVWWSFLAKWYLIRPCVVNASTPCMRQWSGASHFNTMLSVSVLIMKAECRLWCNVIRQSENKVSSSVFIALPETMLCNTRVTLQLI